jgi:hypothetical protein
MTVETVAREASAGRDAPTQVKGTHTIQLLPIVGNPRYTVALMDGTREVGRFCDWLVGEAAMVGYVAGLEETP